MLFAAAIAACDSSTEPKTDGPDNTDVQEALNALPEATVLLYTPDGVPQYIVGALGTIEATPPSGLAKDDAGLRVALPPILKAFRLQSQDMVLRKVSTDAQGARHFRYNQKFAGLDVVGGDLVVHVDARGGIFGANGTARGDIDTTMGVTAVSESVATRSIETDSRWGGMTGRAVTGSRMVYVQAQDGSLHKAYEQVIEGKRGQDPVRDNVYVDVESGSVVAVHPQIMHARNRITYSANNGTTLPGTQKRTEAQGATGDLDVDAAHDGAGHTYDLYKFFFNRDGIDNAGMTMLSSVHYSSNYCNAFWNNTQMAYGDGNASQNCGPLARSIDVAGHEMTHGVTSRESNLTYSGESGGLNESLSDVFGAGVEAYVDGGKNGTLSTASDVFLIGDTVLPPFLRSMCDPAADGSSRDEWTSSLGSVDVHYSSGPNNLVFCLLSKGGMHPRGKTTIPVPAIGMEATLRLMYKANVDLLTASSNYAAMRIAMENAATQLGMPQATKDAVGCAYAAIKVGTAPASCGGSPPPPPPGDTVLSNGVAIGSQSGALGEDKFYKLTVPSGQTSVVFNTSGGTGDSDLYVQLGSHPTTTTNICKSEGGTTAETCTINNPAAGDYFVMIHAYSAYSGMTIKGTYTGGTSGDPYITSGVPRTGLSGASGSNQYFRIAATAGKKLTITITGPGTGDADLYTKAGARPTTSVYDCRPYLSGNAETCTVASTVAGDYYIMLRGFTAYTGVTLTGTLQ